MQNIFLTLIMVLATIQPIKIEKFEPIVVLELFTSQGCSSCPIADDLLERVRAHYTSEKVITLSYHIDYWNYIGWSDPFSKEVFTKKQNEYGDKFSSNSLYTPQMVINGKEHFVGSKKSILKDKLKTYLARSSENKIAIDKVEENGDRINFNYEIDGDITNRKLRVVLVINDRSTSVDRGENKNKVLKNTNIVVEERYINVDETTGKTSISIPRLVNRRTDELSLIVLVQTDNLDITGGSHFSLDI